jgi:hypothetical protein
MGDDFDEGDAAAVRILDPHLGQPPWLLRGPAEDTSAIPGQPLMLGANFLRASGAWSTARI